MVMIMLSNCLSEIGCLLRCFELFLCVKTLKKIFFAQKPDVSCAQYPCKRCIVQAECASETFLEESEFECILEMIILLGQEDLPPLAP